MKFLLTSAGISNTSIHKALIELLGKPVAESKALFIPTAIYGITGGAEIIRKVICGTIGDPFCELGWKSLGLLELTALPTMKNELWVNMSRIVMPCWWEVAIANICATGCRSPDWQKCCHRCYREQYMWV